MDKKTRNYFSDISSHPWSSFPCIRDPPFLRLGDSCLHCACHNTSGTKNLIKTIATQMTEGENWASIYGSLLGASSGATLWLLVFISGLPVAYQWFISGLLVKLLSSLQSKYRQDNHLPTTNRLKQSGLCVSKKGFHKWTPREKTRKSLISKDKRISVSLISPSGSFAATTLRKSVHCRKFAVSTPRMPATLCKASSATGSARALSAALASCMAGGALFILKIEKWACS